MFITLLLCKDSMCAHTLTSLFEDEKHFLVERRFENS